MRELTTAADDKLRFIKGDVNSDADLDAAFASDTFTSVVHFAALKVRQLVFGQRPVAATWARTLPQPPAAGVSVGRNIWHVIWSCAVGSRRGVSHQCVFCVMPNGVTAPRDPMTRVRV